MTRIKTFRNEFMIANCTSLSWRWMPTSKNRKKNRMFDNSACWSKIKKHLLLWYVANRGFPQKRHFAELTRSIPTW